MDGEVIDCPYPCETNESFKVEQNKFEVWDLLGQPSGKFDYRVKYSAPPSAHVLTKSIVPSGWGEKFDEEDGMTKTDRPSTLQVMGIDIWYDSDDPEIIVWDKDNSSKTASQEISQKGAPSINHVTCNGRVY